jgi:hypothetical protein
MPVGTGDPLRDTVTGVGAGTFFFVPLMSPPGHDPNLRALDLPNRGYVHCLQADLHWRIASRAHSSTQVPSTWNNLAQSCTVISSGQTLVASKRNAGEL